MQPFVAKVLGIRNGVQLNCVKQAFAGSTFEDDPHDECYTIDVLNIKRGSDLQCGDLVIVFPMPKKHSVEDIKSGKAGEGPVVYVCCA